MSLLGQSLNLVSSANPEDTGFIADLTADFTNVAPEFRSVAFAPDGDVVAVGLYDREDDVDRQSGILASFDAITGENQWQEFLGGGADNRRVSLRDILIKSDGTAYVSGDNYGGAEEHVDNTYLMSRYTAADGTLLQLVQGNGTVSGVNRVHFNMGCLDNAGNYFGAGITNDLVRGGMIKTNSTFSTVWLQRYYGNQSAFPGEGSGCVVIDDQTQVWWVGRGAHSVATNAFFFERTLLSTGAIIQNRHYAGFLRNADFRVGKMTYKSDDDVAVVCGRSHIGTGDLNGIIWRMGQTGDPGEEQSFGLSGTDTRFYQVCTDQINSIYAAGTHEGMGYIVKLDSAWNIKWQRFFYHSAGVTEIKGICHDQVNRIAIAAHNSVDKLIVATFPDEGSLTGVHGAYTYEVANLTITDPGFAGSGGTSVSDITNVVKTPAQVDGPETLVDSFIDLNP